MMTVLIWIILLQFIEQTDNFFLLCVLYNINQLYNWPFETPTIS